jgi:hypothetical protein
MEENENKKPDGTEGQKPEDVVTPTPPDENGDEKEDKKNKVVAFFAPRRNKIIVGVSAVALIALIVGLSVGLSRCGSGDGGATSSSNSVSNSKVSSEEGSTSSKGDDDSSASKGTSSSGDSISESKTSSEEPSSDSKGGDASSSAHTHSFVSAWKHDADKHWKVCSCGAKGEEGSHAFSTEKVVVKEAIDGADGTKGYKCSVCDYAKDIVSYYPYITNDNFASALKFDGDEFTITITEGNEVSTMVKNGDAVRWTSTAGSDKEKYYSKETESGSAKCYIYSQNSSGTWVKSEDVDSPTSYDLYATRDVNDDYFNGKLLTATRDFNKDKGSYTINYATDDGDDITAELYFDKARIIKAVRTDSNGAKTYTFSDTAEDISLPTNAHMHSYSTTGKLDLNSANGDYVVSCSCGETMSRPRLEADTYDSVLYGYYPQTRITNAATIASLEDLTTGSNDWYKLGDTYYAKVAAGDTDREFKDGTPITPKKEYWYSCDPIEWKVLSSETGKHTLVSSLLLEAHQYDESLNNYKDSEIREWITGTFYKKAFYFDNARIVETKVDNSEATVYETPNTFVCENTTDKVYLLSYQDCVNTDCFADSESRKCQVTDYARASGANFNDDNYGEYWARSPWKDYENAATYVQANGDENWTWVNNSGNCVRPVITVKVPAASDHQHTNTTSGSLDLNSGASTLTSQCSGCGETVTHEYDASTDTITGFSYGYYPQTHVKDPTITAALANKAVDPTTDWYELDGEYYAKATAANTTELKFDDGTTINNGDEYWYKCEPIEWKVLKNNEGTYSLYSSLLLDATQYNSTSWDGKDSNNRYSSNYYSSSLRAWLNDGFLTKAFFKNNSKPEGTTVDNAAGSLQIQNLGLICDNTTDQVYALCYRDFRAKQWGGYFTSDDERKGITTDYARASGVTVSATDNSAKYWTRSPTDATRTSVVDETGYYSNDDDVTAINCVRPAITVKLS